MADVDASLPMTRPLVTYDGFPSGVTAAVSLWFVASLLTLFPIAGMERWLLAQLACLILFLACVLLLGRALDRRPIAAAALSIRWLGLLERLVMAPPRWAFGAGVALVGTALFALFATLVFERTPHVTDSAAQLFHAKIVTSGALSVPAPPLAAEFFEHSRVIHEPRWLSQYPPGHIALLALGVLAGSPWLVNPILGGVTLLFLYLAGREMFDERTGRGTALLGLLAPGIVVMSAGFMNHATALFGFSVFAWGFPCALRRRSGLLGLAAGLAIGLVFATRPLTALGVALPYLAVAAAKLGPRRRDGASVAPVALWMAAGGALGAISLLAFNYGTTGSPWVLGYIMKYGELHQLGFGTRLEGLYTPWIGLRQAAANIAATNFALFYWPLPALPFAAIPLLWRDSRPWAWTLGLSFLGLSLVYVFYFSNIWIHAPRNQYASWAAVAILVSAGLTRLTATVRMVAGDPYALALKALLLPTGLACALFSAIWTTAWADELGHYGGVTAAPRRWVNDAELRDALVFVPAQHWTSLFPENDPRLAGPVVFARDRGARNRELAPFFPTRRPYTLREGSVQPWPSTDENHASSGSGHARPDPMGSLP